MFQLASKVVTFFAANGFTIGYALFIGVVMSPMLLIFEVNPMPIVSGNEVAICFQTKAVITLSLRPSTAEDAPHPAMRP